MKTIAVLCLVVLVAVISSDATETCGCGSESNENSGSGSKEHAGSKSKEHSGLKSKEHSGSKSKEHSGPKSKEHSGSKSKEHSGSKSKENSGSKSKENSGSKSKEHSGSKSKEHSGSGTTSEESCEEKPVFLKVMDINRGIAHCGPENVLNTCACKLDELYWIPCLIEYLTTEVGVKDQPDCYTCVSLANLDCFLRQFPCQCKPHCPNGYGHNATCLP